MNQQGGQGFNVAEISRSRADVRERLARWQELLAEFKQRAKIPVDDSDNFAKWVLEEFEVDGATVMVAPGAGFYSTPGKGKNEIRIAYVLESEKLKKAASILLQAIDAYNARSK